MDERRSSTSAEKPKSNIDADYWDIEDIKDQYFEHSSSRSRKRRLPSVISEHLNAKDPKTLFKCSLAVWINTILIFINPILRVIGQAGFFGGYGISKRL
jgi:hypothetical protein